MLRTVRLSRRVEANSQFSFLSYSARLGFRRVAIPSDGMSGTVDLQAYQKVEANLVLSASWGRSSKVLSTIQGRYE